MLVLKNIVKNYKVAGQPFPALRGVDLTFRNSEFVAIVGPSGCGKTTMLNIIGGLDHYTSGDLLIDGKSTKGFKEHEWDAYRNATIGFVFQSYNLIPHLSVLDNVEMALRLSGVSRKERHARALKVLIEVGLKDHVYKRPNQLSGGQMQRVAIARSLVNNPRVLLADEPTGALDSETSVQIMELIQKISQNRLVILVTHNHEIADRYSDRVVKLLDGRLISDSRPVQQEEVESNEKLMTKRTTMPFWTALKTSYSNLLTKKGRTIITSLAGSIGIIGIALVLSISDGMSAYVSTIQSDTLAGFPISIPTTIREFGPPDTVEPSDLDYPTKTEFTAYDSTPDLHTNYISDEFIDYLEAMNADYFNAITYTRAMSVKLVSLSAEGTASVVTTSGGGIVSLNRNFYEIPGNRDFLLNQYDVIAGSFPENSTEVVLIVDQRNRIDQGFFESYGIDIQDAFTFDEVLNGSLLNLKVIPNDVYYVPTTQNILGEDRTVYTVNNQPLSMFENEASIPLTVTGILRIKPNASGSVLSAGLGYLPSLTEAMFTSASESDIVTDQRTFAYFDEENAGYDVTTGGTFVSEAQYEAALKKIGGITTPTSVSIYPSSFETKDQIKAYIDAYNYIDGVRRPIEEVIIYNDLASNITATITNLIDTIKIVLTAFASISLVVSSIMIGIITYVSVIERTKEIGIMRSLGARKKDIARIFNAETILIGLTAGFLGIVITALLNVPIDFIILQLLELENFTSFSPLAAGTLVLLSTALTLIAGLIPSRIAANKDPVVALRTE